MNQDFLLDCTPANARRMMKLAKIGKFTVDPAIVEISEISHLVDTGCLPWPLSETTMNAARFVEDCSLRAAIPCLNIDEGRRAALAAVVATGIDQIVIRTPLPPSWFRMLRAAGLVYSTDVSSDAKVVLLSKITADDLTILAAHRDGVAIIEWDGFENIGADLVLAQEFERCIIVGKPFHADAGWGHSTASMAKTLFPEAPTSLLDTNAALRSSRLMSRGVIRNHPRDISFLFNVCPFLIERMADQSAD
jgi:hypothetical protein